MQVRPKLFNFHPACHGHGLGPELSSTHVAVVHGYNTAQLFALAFQVAFYLSGSHVCLSCSVESQCKLRFGSQGHVGPHVIVRTGSYTGTLVTINS
eukprot:jgi/Mesvir1/10074/Mv25977-RA.1